MAKKTNLTPPTPLLMAKEFWESSMLSIARHYGGVKFRGEDYIIVDKTGRDVFECSHIAKKQGRSMAIEPREPADLIWKNLQPHYRTLGRDRILELLRDGAGFDDISREARLKLEAEKERKAADDVRRKETADALSENVLEFPD